MKYRLLGKSGLRVSEAALGTMTFGDLPEEQRATRIISAVQAVSKQAGSRMAQVALAWLRHQTVPVIPIVGARKVSQLHDNLASLDLELSCRTVEITQWSKPNRTRIPPEYLRERNGSFN